VKPVDFQYVRAHSVEDATHLLREAGGSGKVLAGGQSLGPLLNMRLVRPSVIVDINAIGALASVTELLDAVRIGATVRQREAERLDIIARRLPLMRDALPHIGHTHTRNRGTIVGSVVHADPSAELPLVALLLDAVLEIAGPEHAREVAIADFYLGYLMTDLGSDELVVAARFFAASAAPGSGRGTAFVEMARREGDFALVAAAVQLDVDLATRSVRDARIGLTGVGGAPFRDPAGEQALRDSANPPSAFRTVAAAASAAIDPDGDLHATATYRRDVAATLLERALAAAWERAIAREAVA
jgi:CO/xanthine dehydrogenase FAD-binding subunit